MSTHDVSETMSTLEALEAEQRERYRPAPDPEPRTPLEAYARALGAARSRPSLSVDVGWLR